MQFLIQAGNPRIVKHDRLLTDGTLEGAMSSIFPIYTEYAVMIWQGVGIPISYGSDIGYMMGDILVMLKDLSEKCRGMRHIKWMPYFFRSIWTISWNEKNVWIKSYWENVHMIPVSILNDTPDIVMDREGFIAEWKMLLRNTLKGLDECGYDGDLLKEYDAIVDVYRSMKQFGRLYPNEPF